MEHYEELGVRPAASAAEIRASYLALARRFHPDRLASESAVRRATAAERMSRINAAWTVLGNRERRARYDALLDAEQGPTSRADIRDVEHTWTPYGDTGEDFDPDLFDDTPSGPPTFRKELAFVPVGLGAVGMATLLVGFVIGMGPLLAVGLLTLVAAGLSFLVLPLIALARSSRADDL